MTKPRRGLGMGLDALFDASSIEVEGGRLRMVPLSAIEPNKDQPRREFDEDSISRYGVLQPLLVRDMGNGRYQLLAGERRWRAARLAGLTELPVQLKELEDQGVLEVALIENLQREDLNPMEQAGGYRRLMDEFSLTQEEVAARVGRSRSAVANTLRLLSLPKTIQDMVQEGALSEGHGRALVGLDESVSLPLALQACEQGLSVRQLERLASAAAKAGREGESPAPEPAKDLYARQLGEALSGRLGRRVQLRPGAKKGRIEIEYYDNQDLCALLEQLGLPVEL